MVVRRAVRKQGVVGRKKLTRPKVVGKPRQRKPVGLGKPVSFSSGGTTPKKRATRPKKTASQMRAALLGGLSRVRKPVKAKVSNPVKKVLRRAKRKY